MKQLNVDVSPPANKRYLISFFWEGGFGLMILAGGLTSTSSCIFVNFLPYLKKTRILINSLELHIDSKNTKLKCIMLVSSNPLTMVRAIPRIPPEKFSHSPNNA